MKSVFEKIIERLEERKLNYFLTIANTGDKKLDSVYETVGNEIDKAIEIVNQAAEEYGDGWIPCSSGKFPEEEGNYLVTRVNGKVNTGMFVFFSNGGFFNPYDNLIAFPERKVIAWQPRPEPYQPKGEL